MSLSCLSDRDSIETQVFGLMNWTKSSLEWSIQLVRIKCVWEREKWCNLTSGCMQGIYKAEMFYSTHTHAHTHTHTCLNYHFHPVMMICGGEILHALSTCLATATGTSSTPQQAARRAAGFSGSCCCPFMLLSLSLTAVKQAKISHTIRLRSNCQIAFQKNKFCQVKRDILVNSA